MLRPWFLIAWAPLLACEAPTRLPWPEASDLGRARAAVHYGIKGGEVLYALAIDLQVPLQPLSVPEDLEAHELWRYPCELSALGLTPGPFPDLDGAAPPARRRMVLKELSWAVDAEAGPRPWPGKAPTVSPCWTFPEPQTVPLPGPPDRRMVPTFLTPWTGDRWLLGVRGVPLHVTTLGADPTVPVALEALPGGPVDVVAGFQASSGTVYVLDFFAQLFRVKAQGGGLEITPLAKIDDDQAFCRAEDRAVPLEIWSMEGGLDADGELEIVASNNCGGIFRYRVADDSWTMVRPTDQLELLLYLEDSTAVRYVGPGEFLVAVAEYGIVTRVRNGRLDKEELGDELALPLKLVRDPEGEIYLGTDAGELRRRVGGHYEVVGRAPPGGVMAAAPLGTGWVLANDLPNGGRQLQPAAPEVECLQAFQRPGSDGGDEIHHLVWAVSRLFALSWHGEEVGDGKIIVYQPTETPSSSCFGDL